MPNFVRQEETEGGLINYYDDGTSSFIKVNKAPIEKTAPPPSNNFEIDGVEYKMLEGGQFRKVNPLDNIDINNMNINTPSSKTSGVFSNVADFESKQKAEEDRIKTEAQLLKTKKAGIIEGQYSPYIQEATAEREKITEATKGQFATDRRASTAALSFVDARRSEAQKQINNLVQMKEQALAQLDVNTQESIDKQLKEWRDYELQLSNYFRQASQDDFNNKMALLGYKMNVDQFNLTKKKTEAETEKTVRENYLQNLNNIVSSGLTADKISSQDKSIYEKSLGLPIGTFDTWYGKMQGLQELKEAGDAYTLMNTINDIAKTIPEGQTMTMGDITIQGTKAESPTANLDTIKDLLDIETKLKNLAGDLDTKDKAQMEVAARKDLMRFGQDPLGAINKLDLFEISYQEAKKAGLDDNSLNPASKAMVTYFNKLLDPTSVVRESEYARVGEGQSLWNRISGTYDKIVQGGAGISQKELAEFSKFGMQLVEGYKNQFVDTVTPIWEQTQNYNLNANNIFTPRMQEWVKTGEALNLNSTEDLFNDFE